MPRRPIAIVRLGLEGVYGEWTTQGAGLLRGAVTLNQGKVASNATVEISDPKLELSNSLPLPQTSSRVPVDIWFGEGPLPPKVFAGYLSGMEGEGLSGRTTLRFVDKGRGLRRVTRGRNLTDTSAGALIRRMALDAGLLADLSRAPVLDTVTFSEALQHGESDWEVLVRISSALGCSIWIRGGTIYASGTGETDATRDPINVVYGQNVKSGFSFRVDELTRRTTPNILDQDGNSVYSSADLLLMDSETVERSIRMERTGLSLTASMFPSFTDQAIEQAARAQARAKKLFFGSVKLTEALPDADVDDQALLRGFGPRWSGVWNIESITHDLVNVTTSLQLYNGGSSV